MKISLPCNNKGCGKLQTPYIDKEDNKVHCSECTLEIANVSPFTIRQMVANKQFREKEKQSFAIKCPICKADQRPIIVNDKVLCSACKKELTSLAPTFITMLKTLLKTADKDI